MERSCLVCGDALSKPSGRGRWPRYCSDDCRSKRKRPSGQHRVLGVRECGWCSRKFEWRGDSTGKCCSVRCNSALRSKIRSCDISAQWRDAMIRLLRCERDDLPSLDLSVWRACGWCGAVMANPPRHKQFCSTRCKHKNYNKANYRPRTYVVTCGECDVEFIARDSRTRYCSEDCWPSHKRINISRWQRLRIYERDRWCCQLCGEKVDRRAKFTDRAPSIDHIIPRSFGGTDDVENLQLAHRGCNSKKGNRGGNEQLALIG